MPCSATAPISTLNLPLPPILSGEFHCYHYAVNLTLSPVQTPLHLLDFDCHKTQTRMTLDRHSTDTKLTPDEESLLACRSNQSISGCKAWTYHPSLKQCWQHSATSPVVARPGSKSDTISGVASGPLPPIPPPAPPMGEGGGYACATANTSKVHARVRARASVRSIVPVPPPKHCLFPSLSTRSPHSPCIYYVCSFPLPVGLSIL